MIRKYLSIVLACLLVLMPNFSLAATEYVPRVVSPIRIGILSDTHFDDAFKWTDDLYADSITHLWPDAVARATEYMQSRGCQAVLHAGDITIGATDINADVLSWITTNVTNRGMVFLPIPGNHETKHEALFSAQPDTIMYPGANENPFSIMTDEFVGTFTDSKGWGKYNIGRWVKILLLNNNVDTTNTANGTQYIQRYANCNTPGKGYEYWASANSDGDPDDPDWISPASGGSTDGNPDYTNPDFSGFQTYNSEQWQFVINELESDDSVWKIPAMHNSIFAYAHQTNRPNRFGQRWGLIAEMSERNVPLIAHGDTHVMSLTHNIHTEESGHMYARDVVDGTDLYAEADSGYSAYGIAEGDSIGIKFLNLRSGLYRGTQENTSDPNRTYPNDAATDVAFYQDSPDTTIGVTDYTLAWFSILSVDGDKGYLEIFNVSINGSGDLTPVRRYHTAISRH